MSVGRGEATTPVRDPGPFATTDHAKQVLFRSRSRWRGIRKRHHLGPAGIQGIKPGHIRLGVWVVQSVFINKIISRDHADMGGGVDPDAPLIVIQNFRIGGSSKKCASRLAS